MTTDDEGNLPYARYLVEALLRGEPGEFDLDEGLAVSDVEGNTAEFVGDLRILDAIGENVPIVRVDDSPVPVALSLLVSEAWATPYNRTPRRRRGFPYYEYPYDFPYDIRDALERGRESGSMETVSHDEARGVFVDRASAFLGVRISALRALRQDLTARWGAISMLSLPKRASGPRIATPGCTFSVSTNSIGLRVHWSGAYRLSQNYFGQPTTPTPGVLQSGTYLFGVDGGAYGNIIHWDQNAVVSLPGNPYVHLNF